MYLVMEYLPGGDLFSLMIRNNRFSEDVIQFYLAEITLALNALHTLGFVHRDTVSVCVVHRHFIPFSFLMLKCEFLWKNVCRNPKIFYWIVWVI